MLFERPAESRLSSPEPVALLLTLAAAVIVFHGAWQWIVEDEALRLSMLWAPGFAFTAWMKVHADHDWPGSTRATMRAIGVAMMVVVASLTVYGFFDWRYRGGDPLLPIFGLASLVLGPVGWRRRMRRAAGDPAS